MIHNNKYFIFRFINQGYNLFYIVKNFTQKLLWNSSCIAFMFLMPMLFEIMSEQEAVLDKIQRDDMIALAADMGPPTGAVDAPIVRPF